jgi:hypothetical protein
LKTRRRGFDDSSSPSAEELRQFSRRSLSLGVPAWSDSSPTGSVLPATTSANEPSTRYRDGLLIALLISCPMRLENLALLVIGQHLVFDRALLSGEAHGGGNQDGQTPYCGGAAQADHPR